MFKRETKTDEGSTGSGVSSVDSGFAEEPLSPSNSSSSLQNLGKSDGQTTLTKEKHGSTSTLGSSSSNVKNLNESDAIKERTNTFVDEGWDQPVPMHDLAQAGFECTGKDEVVCVYCGVEISTWKFGEIPLKRHIKESPKCTFAKYRRKQTKKKKKSNIVFDSRKPLENEDYSDDNEDDESNIYLSEFNRLISFGKWPLSSPVDPYDLAAAGFYRVPSSSNVVQCYTCEVKVNDWNPGDRPKKKHEQLNSECPHFKGNETSGNKPLHSSEKIQAVHISIQNE